MVSQIHKPPLPSQIEASSKLIRCIVCGNNQWENKIQLGEYTIIKCKVCSLGQIYPLPDQVDIQETNRVTYTINKRLFIYKARQKELRRRYHRLINQIIDLHPGTRMKILDIGCSIGIFLLTAQERGFETYGVDISELSAEYARKQFHLNVFSGTLEAAHYPDNTFDIITLWDVIEHVLEPGLLLAEAKRVLKCNGVGGLFQIIYSILHPCLYQDRSSRMDMKS